MTRIFVEHVIELPEIHLTAVCRENRSYLHLSPRLHSQKIPSVLFVVWPRFYGPPHYEAVDKVGNYRVAVNARMMDSSDIEGIELRMFNGTDM
ncbi:MAG TPA: hypothetical protein QGF41_06695 [Gammaproteobacteria bacterium]|nr:hypothetical protein [Gammaproteobacteria bacterium]